jgi:hypothetical protein
MLVLLPRFADFFGSYGADKAHVPYFGSLYPKGKPYNAGKAKIAFRCREERQKLKKESEAMVKMRIAGEWNKETFVEHFKPIEERIMQIDVNSLNWKLGLTT